jgi:hypothetical protein
MSEETTTETQTTTEEQTTTEPAYRPGYVKGLETQLAEFKAKFDERDKAEAEAKSKAVEEQLLAEKNWTGLEAKYKADAEKAAAEHAAKIAQLEANAERERNKASMVEVPDAQHREFLIDAYQKAEDKKESFDAWYEYAKTVDSFKVFFNPADSTALPAGPGGPAATRSSGSLEEQMKSPDPKIAKAAREAWTAKHLGG